MTAWGIRRDHRLFSPESGSVERLKVKEEGSIEVTYRVSDPTIMFLFLPARKMEKRGKKWLNIDFFAPGKLRTTTIVARGPEISFGYLVIIFIFTPFLLLVPLFTGR